MKNRADTGGTTAHLQLNMSSIVERSGAAPRAAAAPRRRFMAWLPLALCACGLAVSAVAQPVNDNFTNSISIGGFIGSVNGTTTFSNYNQSGKPYREW